MMKQERFFDIIAAYGANPARWPEAEQDAVLAFIEAHPDLAGEALADAAALDALMEPDAVMPSDLLQRRILKAFPGAPAPVVARPQWQVPVAAAAALVLGVFIGFASGALTVPASDMTEDTIFADAFNGLDQDWVDWLGGDV